MQYLGNNLDPSFMLTVGLIMLATLLSGWALTRLCIEIPKLLRQSQF